MAATKTSIYLGDDMRKKLHVEPFGDRGASYAVSLTVDRYAEIIRAGKIEIKSIFTDEEMNAIYNACSGTIFEPAYQIKDGVLINIQDSTPDEIETFGCNKKTLEGKLKGLTISQQTALVEAIEDWWSRQGK